MWNRNSKDSQKPELPGSALIADGAQNPPSVDAATQLRRVMPDLYFINTPASQMPRHVDLLQRVEKENLLVDFRVLPHSLLTECSICAFDDVDPGLLAKVCGTLANLRIDIQTAFIFTVKPLSCIETTPKAPASAKSAGGAKDAANRKRGIVLDTFFVSELHRGQSRALSPTTIERVRTQLLGVLRGEVPLTAPVGTLRRPALAPVIHEISAVNSSALDLTMITLRAQNSPGILYRTTAALAALKLDIRIAQINTEADATNDVFFVTKKNGQVLSESELLRLAPRLRALLSDTSPPAEPLKN